MSQRRACRLLEHPLAFSSLRSWLRLLWNNKDIDRKFMPRALMVTLSTFLTSPLRVYETRRYSRIVRNTAIRLSPVFIVGHWRTGTTHLHNLLCQDKNHGYVSTFQAFAPGLCLLGEKTIKGPFNWIARKLHPTREIDNIPLSMDKSKELGMRNPVFGDMINTQTTWLGVPAVNTVACGRMKTKVANGRLFWANYLPVAPHMAK